LLFVEQFAPVRQEVSAVSVSFDDEAIAAFFEAQVDAGRKPEQFARIWVHTHPADSPQPSVTDEQTFRRVFGRCDWAVLFILARSGRTYARLRFNTGPGGQILIPVEVDYRRPFEASNHEAWEAEYQACIVSQEPAAYLLGADTAGRQLSEPLEPLVADDLDWLAESQYWRDRDEAGWLHPAGEATALEDLI